MLLTDCEMKICIYWSISNSWIYFYIGLEEPEKFTGLSS